MRTDLITYNPGATEAMTVDTIQGAAAAPFQPPSVTSVVVEWAQNMDACVQLADRIVDTELVPIAYWPLPKGVKAKDVMPRLPLMNEDQDSYQHRRRIAVATTAGVCYRGAELGMSWPQAVASIYMVGGRPGLYAEAMVALVKARGHRIEVVERGRTRCELRTLRRGDTDWQTFEYTIEDAEVAGYVPGKGPNVGGDSWKGNSKYVTDPAAMLYARDASIMCRTVYPDVLGGLVVVELAADEPVDVTDTTTVTKVTAADILAQPAPPTPAAVSAVRQEPNPAAASQPPSAPLPGDGESSPDVSTDPAPLTEKQWREINGLFVTHGVTGDGQKERRLRVLDMLFGDPESGRTITRGQDLTEAEGQIAIDSLRANGPAIIAEALGAATPTVEPDADAVAEQEAAEATYQSADDAAAEAEQQAAAVDPTTDDAWGDPR